MTWRRSTVDHRVASANASVYVVPDCVVAAMFVRSSTSFAEVMSAPNVARAVAASASSTSVAPNAEIVVDSRKRQGFDVGVDLGIHQRTRAVTFAVDTICAAVSFFVAPDWTPATGSVPSLVEPAGRAEIFVSAMIRSPE